jgi:hypothetical protein
MLKIKSCIYLRIFNWSLGYRTLGNNSEKIISIDQFEELDFQQLLNEENIV